MKKGIFFVVSGPSGVGKGTIVSKVLKKNDNLRLSVSATTREPRTGERDGVNYFFMTESEFLRRIDNGEFLEYTQTYGIYYGTLKANVESQIAAGKDALLEIDVKGALKLINAGVEACYVFIAPKSFGVLEERLRKRGTESEEKIRTRIEVAHYELSCVEKYDYLIINDDLETACNDFNSIINSFSLLVKKQNLERYDWHK